MYVPHYRQATIAAFLDNSGNREQALDLAYSDVQRAFRYFREHYNRDRPLIIAGHSQGAFHADRLLREAIADETIRQRLVAAYTIGFALSPNDRVPVCQDATQTGCQLNWNTQTEGAATAIGDENSICVNPLNWEASGNYAAASMNTGAFDFASGTVNLEPRVADARCVNGLLFVSQVESENFKRMPFGRGNYHLYDYGLYYRNIRDNVNERVRRFMENR